MKHQWMNRRLEEFEHRECGQDFGGVAFVACVERDPEPQPVHREAVCHDDSLFKQLVDMRPLSWYEGEEFRIWIRRKLYVNHKLRHVFSSSLRLFRSSIVRNVHRILLGSSGISSLKVDR